MNVCRISADKGTLNRDYIPHLQKFLVKPLIDHGVDGVPQSMALMEQYSLLREDLDSILELRQGLAKDDLWAKVDPKVSYDCIVFACRGHSMNTVQAVYFVWPKFS